ncbi:MAG: hypothetical protein PVSMB1_13010 [Gemmatimonadaceae bacterium]
MLGVARIRLHFVRSIVCADIPAHYSHAYTHGGCHSKLISTTPRAVKTRDPQLGASMEETHLTFQSETIESIYPTSTLPSR